jgi:hypothetical protein
MERAQAHQRAFSRRNAVAAAGWGCRIRRAPRSARASSPLLERPALERERLATGGEDVPERLKAVLEAERSARQRVEEAEERAKAIEAEARSRAEERLKAVEREMEGLAAKVVEDARAKA